MKYGQHPIQLGTLNVNCKEMMFYQYLPIKLGDSLRPMFEERLNCFTEIIEVITDNYIRTFGWEDYCKSYVYLTARHLYQEPGMSFNRPGYHSDGFLTDDINYIWSNNHSTIFNISDFELTEDNIWSLTEMDDQAKKENEITYPDGSLLRLNQFNIHKVAPIIKPCMRTFLKLSFSKDRYDLLGNSHNYLLDYEWHMKERKVERNIPQSKIIVKK